MSTTIKGDLHDLNTEDKIELSRPARKYSFNIKASGGGTVKFKIDRLTSSLVTGVGADHEEGKFVTLVERFTTDSGQTTESSFTLPETLGTDGMGGMRLIFSRNLGTKGVDYEFFMEPA
ncbi:MAG: hypothetical protein AUG51_09145 [Acidobacteria bacterium 13_1_20CM_3_53_8]|nr:MAG: hypothetical protein AUG51_09145 [Acidobacteria bacterium 13_1_20CM_3_53_8]